MYNGNASTSHYTEYGTMPTLTEEQKQSVLNPEPYVLPEAGAESIGGVLKAENVPESTATTVAGLKDTVNAILSALKASGAMEPDAEDDEENTETET